MSQVFFPFSPATDLTGRSFDPYYKHVVFHLHGEGANTGTTVTDSSPYANVPVTQNGVTTSTTIKKFGGSSLLVANASSNGLYYTGVNASMTGDFTAELFFANGVATIPLFFLDVANQATLGGLYLYIETASNFQVWRVDASNSTVWNSLTNVISPSLTSNVFAHIGLCRVGTTIYIFCNGVITSTVTGISATQELSNPLMGANHSLAGFDRFHGSYDEVRITKDVGRYTTAYNVPTAAFADH